MILSLYKRGTGYQIITKLLRFWHIKRTFNIKQLGNNCYLLLISYKFSLRNWSNSKKLFFTSKLILNWNFIKISISFPKYDDVIQKFTWPRVPFWFYLEVLMVGKLLTKFEVNCTDTSWENKGGTEGVVLATRSDTADQNSEVEIGLKVFF